MKWSGSNDCRNGRKGGVRHRLVTIFVPIRLTGFSRLRVYSGQTNPLIPGYQPNQITKQFNRISFIHNPLCHIDWCRVLNISNRTFLSLIFYGLIFVRIFNRFHIFHWLLTLTCTYKYYSLLIITYWVPYCYIHCNHNHGPTDHLLVHIFLLLLLTTWLL